MAELIKYHIEDKIAFVTLNRPEKLNALNFDFKNEIIAGIEQADKDSAVSVIVLNAEGRAFSVGFDIGGSGPERDKGRDDSLHWDPPLHNSLEMALAPWNASKPVIASVQGYTLGGGCELAMMCDLTIAADDAKFGEPEVRFSHVGPVVVMPWMIGLKRARELLYFGDMIDANTALDFGMINRVVPRDELFEYTKRYARRLALIDPVALRWGKRSVNRSAEISGMRSALESGVDGLVALYAAKTEVGKEFDRLVRVDGLKAALDWRANQFRELKI
jgi:enoyl-CoA hydratase/carnithine racemase